MRLPSPSRHAVPIALFALMLATRLHHLGDALHLPDASMAVFFLGGLYLRRHSGFAAFLAAVAIDYLAIAGRGQDFFAHYCVTPSYAFLLLAYAVLWYAGRAWSARMGGSARALAGGLAVAALAAAVSFLISNGAFYWLGGRYASPHLAEYLARVWRWGPLFVATALGYIATVFAAHALWMRRPRAPLAPPPPAGTA